MKELQQDYHCAIDMVIELIGGKWKVLILWNLNEGDKRFNELRRSIPDITQKMLTQQLRELEAHGLVSRTVFQEVPPRVEYATTDLGKKLQKTLFEMCRWGDDYAEEKGINMNRCWTTYDFMEKQT
ncbi:ArsR family transcriptional regulator [Rossellomorea marisflavi]|uniref:ArsR family transcriptional regulator n=1 Tax=Rossellomorea marisflavi TaxID=189381 RepID=A0A0M0G2M8_9BACI|nr:helix-turn-helix domain-containing protein [Rossellomorea marisflavi]KON83857.1 ArsR family transcriptional regulator [Rossellomorea marisflavi]MCM2590035.1 helix-turn-helix transcriptional regulator [Rossellomorea marisflavi]MDR4935649.1 helix-turn-helix domain-containing protein [Rossellomorea marisflavi]